VTERGSVASSAALRVRDALAAEHVPDHDDEFWQELGTRLIAERSAPAAPPLDPLDRLEQIEHRPGVPTDEPASRRHERRRKRRSPEAPAEPIRPTVSQLAEQAEWMKQATPNWRRRLLVAAGAAALAGVLGAAIWLGAATKPGTPILTAGGLAETMSKRLTSSPYVSGNVDTVGFGAATGRYAFVRSSDGSLRYRALDRRSDSVYDVRTGAGQRWSMRDGGAVDASTDIGLAPGPPDVDGADRYLQGDELRSIIRSLEASPRTVAHSRTRDGRKVWVIDARLPAASNAPVDAVHLIVDRERQLPIEVSRSVKGKVVRRSRFTALRTSNSVPPDTFRLTGPAPIGPPAFDNGFRESGLPSAASLVGYVPATPGWLPSGYELSTIAVLRGSPLGLPATAGGDNPPNQDVTSLVYRRMLEQLTVTLRRVAAGSDYWKDPFLAQSQPSGRIQRLRLDGGRFVGTMVEQVSAPGVASHVWGRTSNYVFTVAGDLEPSQLVRVASSLR